MTKRGGYYWCVNKCGTTAYIIAPRNRPHPLKKFYCIKCDGHFTKKEMEVYNNVGNIQD